MSGLKRWTFEFPGPRRSHRGHRVQTVVRSVAPLNRSRPRIVARLCLTCRVITREWRACGVVTMAGTYCRGRAVEYAGKIYPCVYHGAGAYWVGRGVRRAS